MRNLQNQLNPNLLTLKRITLLVALSVVFAPSLQAQKLTPAISTDGLTLTITDKPVNWSCGYDEIEYVDIAIVVSEGAAEIAGFDFFLTFDSLGATLVGVSQGSAIDRMQWRLFASRVVASPIPPQSEHDNLSAVRVVGFAVTANKYDTLTYDISAGDTLAVLHFRLNHYRNYTTVQTILRWAWADCADNLIMDYDWNTLFASDSVFDHRNTWGWTFLEQGPNITDYSGTFPTQGGMPNSCEALFDSAYVSQELVRRVNYESGGIFAWGGDCSDVRGDVNGDGWTYQPDDALYLVDLITQDSSYFDDWLHTWNIHLHTSDINQNGIPFEVADLTHFNRLMTHDDIPPSFMKHDDSEIRISHDNNIVSVDREAGAVLLIFDGRANITLLQEQMELRIGMRDGNTHALVYDISQSVDSVAKIEPGELVRSFGNLISVEAAEYQGTRLRTHISHTLHNPSGALTIVDQHSVIQGAHRQTAIIYNGETMRLRELELSIGYDSTHFPSFDATLGPKFDNDGVSFEARIATLPESQIPAVGVNTLLEIELATRGETLTLSDGDTVAVLNMLISGNRDLECALFPIYWVWQDCDNNTLSANSRRYVSRSVYSTTYTEPCHDDTLRDNITELNGELPTINGASGDCRTKNRKRRPEHRTARTIDFYSGAFRIACADSIDARSVICFPGDSTVIDCWIDVLLGRCDNHHFPNLCWDIYNAPYLSDFQRLLYYSEPPCPPIPPDTTVDTLTITIKKITSNGYRRYVTDRPFGSILLTFEGEGSTTVYKDFFGQIGERDSETVNDQIRYLLYNRLKVVYPSERDLAWSQPKLVAAYAATPDGRDMVVILDFATDVSDEVSPALPKRFALKQNYPNPYNPRTKISFDLPRKSAWELSVYNIAGQIVKRFTGENSAGTASVSIESASWASGVYFYKLTAGEFTATRKMVLLK